MESSSLQAWGLGVESGRLPPGLSLRLAWAWVAWVLDRECSPLNLAQHSEGPFPVQGACTEVRDGASFLVCFSSRVLVAPRSACLSVSFYVS